MGHIEEIGKQPKKWRITIMLSFTSWVFEISGSLLLPVSAHICYMDVWLSF